MLPCLVGLKGNQEPLCFGGVPEKKGTYQGSRKSRAQKNMRRRLAQNPHKWRLVPGRRSSNASVLRDQTLEVSEQDKHTDE